MKIKVNNVTIFYKVYGKGKPIILLHGNSETHKIFTKLINKLKEDYGYYLGQHYASGGNGSFPYQGKIQFEEIMSRFYEKYNENRNSKQF